MIADAVQKTPAAQPGDATSAAPTARRKVCHIIHNDAMGGGATSVISQLVAFTAEFDLSVIHGGSGRIAEACERMNLPHWQVPLDRPVKLPVGLVALASRLRKLRPDVVILHGQWAGPVGGIAARLAGISRVIYICHWPAFYTDWDFFRIVRNRLAEDIPCHFASRVVVLSRGSYYQYLLRQIVPPEKMRLIHNWVDPGDGLPAAPIPELLVRHGWDGSICNVLAIGRLADQKRFDWLLRTWKIVTAQAANARLWIIGDGPEKEALERLDSQLGLRDSCVFLGAHPEARNFITAADFIAMTSLYEGHALIPLEAMACGKAIVASDVDGVNDSITDGVEGFLIPAGDIEWFADRILRLIAEPGLRKAMGARGRQRIEHFSSVRGHAEYRALIHEVLAEPAAH